RRVSRLVANRIEMQTERPRIRVLQLWEVDRPMCGRDREVDLTDPALRAERQAKGLRRAWGERESLRRRRPGNGEGLRALEELIVATKNDRERTTAAVVQIGRAHV